MSRTAFDFSGNRLPWSVTVFYSLVWLCIYIPGGDWQLRYPVTALMLWHSLGVYIVSRRWESNSVGELLRNFVYGAVWPYVVYRERLEKPKNVIFLCNEIVVHEVGFSDYERRMNDEIRDLKVWLLQLKSTFDSVVRAALSSALLIFLLTPSVCFALSLYNKRSIEWSYNLIANMKPLDWGVLFAFVFIIFLRSFLCNVFIARVIESYRLEMGEINKNIVRKFSYR